MNVYGITQIVTSNIIIQSKSGVPVILNEYVNVSKQNFQKQNLFLKKFILYDVDYSELDKKLFNYQLVYGLGQGFYGLYFLIAY